MKLEEIDLTEWERVLPNHGHSPFHTPEALGVLDEHSTATMRLFAGYNGQQPIALLPLFVKDESFGRMVLSPPLQFGIRSLGPILMPSSPKPSKREKINHEFTQGIIDAVGANAASTLFHISCETAYRDPRPYKWAGFNVEPRYTYQLDLGSTTQDDLLSSFSRSLRREIRDAEDEEITVREGGESAARAVYEATKHRYEEQGEAFGISLEYVLDLTSALDDRAAVYVAESAGGEFLSGIVVLYTNDTAYFWKGGTRRSQVDLDVNSLLHWRVIEDIFEDASRASITTYDFFTANNPSIVRFKRKFSGQLTPYYRIESSGVPMTIAKRAYRLKRDLLA